MKTPLGRGSCVNVSRPWMARLRYVFSFYSMVDLVAIVPFYFAKVGGTSGVE